jgi:hypothetical protein
MNVYFLHIYKGYIYIHLFWKILLDNRKNKKNDTKIRSKDR